MDNFNWKRAGILGILVLGLFSVRIWAGEGLTSAGILNRGNWDLKPGNDFEQGLEVGYSNLHLASHNLEIKAAYLTTRLQTLFREGVSTRDILLFSPVWHFRRRNVFDPLARIDFGYGRYDGGGWIGSAQAGLNLNMFRAQWGLSGHAGYAFLAPASDQDFPGVFGMGIWVML